MEQLQRSSKIQKIAERGQNSSELANAQNMKPAGTTTTLPAEAPLGLSDVLIFLLEKLEPKSYWFQRNQRNAIAQLRLVSKSTKECIDSLRPIETLKLYVRDISRLHHKVSFAEKVKHLVFYSDSESGDIDYDWDLQNIYVSALSRCNLQLEKLTFSDCGKAAKSNVPHLSNWPSLTCLEVRNEQYRLKTLSCLSKVPLASLKELVYASVGAYEEAEIVAAALSNMEGVTKLHLNTYILGDLQKCFPKSFLQNLVDLKLHTNVKPIVDSKAPAIDVEQNAEEHPESEATNPLTNLKYFEFRCNERSLYQTKFLMHILSNACCLEELLLAQWNPRICRLQDLKLPCLQSLELSGGLSLAGYEDLTAATFPALESLEISEWQRYGAALPSFLPNFSTSPFPALRSLKVRDLEYNDDPAWMKFIKPRIPSLKELDLSRVTRSTLETLFELNGASGAGTSSGSSKPLLWPHLDYIEIGGDLDHTNLKVLKLLPAHLPSLEYLILRDWNGRIAEVETFLKDAAKEGIWYKMKLVVLRTGDLSYVQIWPYLDDGRRP